MAVNILITPPVKKNLFSHFTGNTKTKPLTLSQLIKIIGANYNYGHRNTSNYSFRSYDDETITGVDIVVYNPSKIGRGIICCVNENATVEVVLNTYTTTHDIELFFEVTKKLCEYFNTNHFIIDEKYTDVAEIDDVKSKLITWNTKTIGEYINEMQDNTLIVLGAVTPIYMEEEVARKILACNSPLEQEQLYSNYINEKQSVDCYYFTPNFYQNKKSEIFAMYALTQGVDSIIPKKTYVPFNAGLDEHAKVNHWFVTFVAEEEGNYKPLGCIRYNDLLKELPTDTLPLYDAEHYMIKGFTKQQLEDLLQKYKTEIE